MSDPTPIAGPCLRHPEAADYLAISSSQLFELVKSGQLRSIKVGRARRYPVSYLDEFVAAHTEGGDRAAAS